MQQSIDQRLTFWENMPHADADMDKLLEKYLFFIEKMKLEQRRAFLKDPNSCPPGMKFKEKSNFPIVSADQEDTAIINAIRRSNPGSMNNSAQNFAIQPDQNAATNPTSGD